MTPDVWVWVNKTQFSISFSIYILIIRQVFFIMPRRKSTSNMPVRTALFSYDAQDDEEYSFSRGDQLVLCRSRNNSLIRTSTSEISEDSRSPKTLNSDKTEWVRMKRLGSISNGGYIPRSFLQSIENTFVYSLENYEAQLEDEISFLKFEKIEIVSKSIVPDEGYALGRLITGEIGVFPLHLTSIDKPTELLYLEEKELDDCFEEEKVKIVKNSVKKTVSAPVKMESEKLEDFKLRDVPKRDKKRRTVKDLAKMFETLDEHTEKL